MGERPFLCRIGIHWDRVYYTGMQWWTCQRCCKSTIPDDLPFLDYGRGVGKGGSVRHG